MTRIRRADHAVYHTIQPAGGVLLHVESGAYHRVNEMGSLIWDLLQKLPSRSELLAELRSRIEDAPDCLDADVDEFLQALKERELIVMESDQPAEDALPT